MESVSLAEPRRRQKWTLNPRGNLWANDESKFGQKLMEKMGWSKGKGLGANENGRVQHVSVKQKDNNKGVGFEGHDDTWLAHQSDFQNVLAALNIEHGDKGKEMSETEKKANLEEISKKSRRRVHYQKFVRGKDLKNYSADDLGCILGTKSEKVKNKSDQTETPEDEKEEAEEAAGEAEKNFVQGGNYADYFAKKMADLKARGKLSSVPSSWTETTGRSGEQEEQEGSEEVRAGFGTSQAGPTSAEEQSSEADLTTKKEKEKKKKKKSKKSDHEDAVNFMVEEENPVAVKKKKSKKDKKKEATPGEVVLEAEGDTAVKKKKSKKSKDRRGDSQQCEELQETKKKEQKERIDSVISNSSDEASEDVKKKKRKKSKKEREEVEVAETPAPDSGCEDEDTKYKKTKKVKKEKTKEKKTTYSDEEKENRKRKNKTDPEEERSTKKEKVEEDSALPPPEDSKFVGFKGSNLLSISGYGK